MSSSTQDPQLNQDKNLENQNLNNAGCGCDTQKNVNQPCATAPIQSESCDDTGCGSSCDTEKSCAEPYWVCRRLFYLS